MTDETKAVTAERAEAARVVAQACVDWAADTGDCHMCGEYERTARHWGDCPVNLYLASLETKAVSATKEEWEYDGSCTERAKTIAARAHASRWKRLAKRRWRDAALHTLSVYGKPFIGLRFALERADALAEVCAKGGIFARHVADYRAARGQR